MTNESKAWHLGISQRLIVWLVVLISGPLTLLVARAVEPNFSYNRWDNYEYYSPAITEAHSLWLKLELPLLNPHQHMGEPTVGTQQPAPFYFPYTVAVAVTQAFDLNRFEFSFISVLLHTAFGALGWYVLFRKFRVSRQIAALGAWTGMLNGLVVTISPVWIFVASISSWIPWLLYLSYQTIHSSKSRYFAFLIIALAFVQFIGHPQLAIYAWIASFLWGAYWIFVSQGRVKKIAKFLVVFFWAGLISAIHLLPSLEFVKIAARKEIFTSDQFFARSLKLSSVLDFLTPLRQFENGFFPNKTQIFLQQGSWLVPVIISFLVLVYLGRKGSSLLNNEDRNVFSDLRAPVVGGLALGFLFLLFALGKSGLLLRLTYGMPIWSSFRNPFKFLPFVLPFFLFSSVLLLNSLEKLPCLRLVLRKIVLFTAIVSILALTENAVTRFLSGEDVFWVHSFWGWGVFLAGASSMVLLLYWNLSKWSKYLFFVSHFAFVFAAICLAQQGSHQTYSRPSGVTGLEVLGINADHRVMPLSMLDLPSDKLSPEEYGLFHSATANGYRSPTGHHTTGMMPTWYYEWMPSNLYGLIPTDKYQSHVGSSLFRHFNIGYYVVSRLDQATQALLTGKGLRVIKETERALVFEDPHSLPRAYFASKALGTDVVSLSQLLLGEAKNLEPIAIVEAKNFQKEYAPKAVLGVEDISSSKFQVSFEPSVEESFLVFAFTHYPGWRAIFDNGEMGQILRTNGAVMGVTVPAGVRSVQFEFWPLGLSLGIWISLVSTFALIGLLILRKIFFVSSR